MVSRLKIFYIFKCFRNCFKISLNKMICKMTLIPLPWGSGRDKTNPLNVTISRQPTKQP